MGIPDLPDDILWYIFSQNLPIHPVHCNHHEQSWYEEGLMGTATSTSQVCQTWRRVMLSLPNIWSKVIDLSDLNNYSKPTLWLQELL